MSPPGVLERTRPGSALADLLPLAAQRFAEAGALGLVLVQADGLERVERSHGLKGYQKVRGALHAVVTRYVGDHLDPSSMISPGELGA